ncbi:MAG: hypothetical protein OER86_05960 [Phycisphaerae bacterium]|nr:hypothetical protein [Phycisphaerae bacterium]
MSGSHPIASSLRLVHPPAGGPDTVRPVAATGATKPAATYRFESIYARALPRVPMTEAHQRLERIRQDLVASRTDVPIHFQQQPIHAGSAASAAHARAYLRFPADPPAINADATERQILGE